MDSPPHPLFDPIFEGAPDLKLNQFAPPYAPHPAEGAAHVCAGMDRYDVAVALHAVYEWGGCRYTNALDAIAAAKRGGK